MIIKFIIKICRTIADWLLNNLNGCKVRWGNSKEGGKK